MKIFLTIIGAVLLFWLISTMLAGKKPEAVISKPAEYIPNDKLVVVKNAQYDDLKKVLNDFCAIYNSDKLVVTPRLTKISDTEFTITFPYDTDFVTYSFLVNYLKYPKDIKSWNADVNAWLTTKSSDQWITEKSANKKVRLFLALDDREYDNVFLTTEDNIGYKLGFAAGETSQLLGSPKEPYIAPTVDINSLTGKTSEDFH
ncbi:MAG: hypothetical protein AAB681_00665 [Patescibacteria group bacterium]|mgnify:CR=1 FL=1